MVLLLLPLLLVTAFTPPVSLSESTDLWERDTDEVGPGCVDGEMVYPGIPPEVATQCPPVDPAETVLITNMYDCSSFYWCEEGVAYLNCCRSGLLWDPPMRVCDTPPHVDCGSRPILDYPTTPTTPESTTIELTTHESTTPEPTTPEPTTPEPTIPESTTPEPTTPTPTETNTPTETTTVTPSEANTPTETTTLIPTETTSVTPTETSTPSETTPPPTAPPPTTTPTPPIDSKCDDLPGYDGRLPAEQDCSKYYQCEGGDPNRGKLINCPVGEFGQMVFNPTTQDCDHQWHYPCDDHTIYPLHSYFSSWFSWFPWF